MINKIRILILLLVFATGISAQTNIYTNSSNGITSVNEAAQLAEQIVKASGRKANFLIAEANVQNAVAVLSQGKRYVFYNPNFINAITKATGTKWAAVSVLAHEIGHHLYQNSSNSGKMALATELEADEFSGYVLEKMGASLEEAQAAMNLIATPYATTTHPGREDRTNSIATGWQKAGGVIPNYQTAEKPVYVSNDQKASSLPSSSIAATIVFNAEPDAEIYVTKRMNVVKIANNQVSTIARIAKSNSSDYPYIIYDDSGYRLYVNNDGVILNRSGRIVGQLKSLDN